MVEVLRFSRRETAFAPETIEILAAALDETWERLEKSGSQLTRPAYSRVVREVVAKRIMELAQRGERDRKNSCKTPCILSSPTTRAGIEIDRLAGMLEVQM
jgi:hypothetical protein